MNITLDRFTTLVFLFFTLAFMLIGLQIGSQWITLMIFVLIAFLSLMLGLIFKHKSFGIDQFKLFMPFFVFQFIYIMNYTSSVHFIIYQFVFGVIFFVTANLVWKKGHINLFSLLALMIYPVLAVYLGLNLDKVNPNTIGGFVFLLSFFPLLYLTGYAKNLKGSRIFLFIAILSVLIVASGARSILLSIAFGLITLIAWKFITKTKILFNLYFFVMVVFGYMFTVIYPKLDMILTNYQHYNYLMIQYTGKSILSGRDEIWKALIEVIKLKPFFGYGSGAAPSEYIPFSLSAHNLYLHIALQVGIVGLFFFLLFLFVIWKRFWLNRHDSKVILSACFFIGILIYQLSEVSLIQNNFTFSMLQWMIIGIGLSYCINPTSQTNKTN